MLHIISTNEQDTLRSMLLTVSSTDTIAVLGEVVSYDKITEIFSNIELNTTELYFISDQNLGQKACDNEFNIIGYNGLVELCEQHSPIQTWY